MSSIDKQSVREEFDRLKQSYKDMSNQKDISKEVALLVNNLFTLIEIILAIFCEKKTSKNSSNSGKPSSQTDKDDSALSHKGSKGKGKEINDSVSDNTRTIETVSVLRVDFCKHCGATLEDVPCDCVERRTRIDIIFEKKIEHIDAQVKTCPQCRKKNKAKHPADMPGKIQYGNGIKSYILHLLISQMVPLNRIGKLLLAMTGQKISEATMLSYVMRLHLALAEWEVDAKRQLFQTKSLHVDETSLRVDKKNYWIHVYSSGDVTLKFLHSRRGKQALVDIGIIPEYEGAIIHDCWSPYLSYRDKRHGLCGSHLLRELTFVIDSNGYRWARNMKKLLQDTCRNVSKSNKKCLTDKEYMNIQKRYRNILTRAK